MWYIGQTRGDEDLLRESQKQLRSALAYCDLGERPLGLFPVVEALRDLDAYFDQSNADFIDIGFLLDLVRHAIRAAWTHSNVSEIPVFAGRFLSNMKHVEARILGEYRETVSSETKAA